MEPLAADGRAQLPAQDEQLDCPWQPAERLSLSRSWQRVFPRAGGTNSARAARPGG